MLLTGNDFGTETISGRYDASVGTILKDDGKSGFTPVPPADGGLTVTGNSRGTALLTKDNGWLYLIANNAGPLQAFSLTVSRGSEEFLAIPAGVLTVKIYYSDSTHRRREFYYGSSYLSQSGRSLPLTGQEVRIELYDFAGKVRAILPEQLTERQAK